MKPENALAVAVIALCAAYLFWNMLRDKPARFDLCPLCNQSTVRTFEF